jgi:hypothetical protein
LAREPAADAIEAARVALGVRQLYVAVDADAKGEARDPASERADARIRTGDPFITSEVLYQLSYVGEGPYCSGMTHERSPVSGASNRPRTGFGQLSTRLVTLRSGRQFDLRSFALRRGLWAAPFRSAPLTRGAPFTGTPLRQRHLRGV